MADRSRSAPPVLLGASQAGASLTLASTAWMVSGLTASPLLNSLLPALGALPLLVPLRRTPKGYGLQLLSVVVLIALSLAAGIKTFNPTPLLIGSFVAVLLFGVGQEMSSLPLQRRLLSQKSCSMLRLRRGQDVGALVGNLLAALLFPAIRQFVPALVLLLPLAGVAASPTIQGTTAEQPSGEPSTGEQHIPWDARCMLQGLVMGGLFALLALWVRQVDGGKCFDFAMVLAAYGLGRIGVGLIPAWHRSLGYLLMAVLLVITQVGVPASLAVLLFLPIGALAASTDAALVAQLERLGDAPLRWQVMLRSGAVGGVVGSIGLGVICQLLTLSIALPLVVAGFLLLAITQLRSPLALSR